MLSTVPVTKVTVSAYTIPTATPESDGTLEWTSTTLVVVEAAGGGKTGLGYTYADTATAYLFADRLSGIVDGNDALAVQAIWAMLVRAIRNLGRPGIASMAIAAVDTALWDLKARLLDLPLVTLLGSVGSAVPVYGSGGFTSASLSQLREQLWDWTAQGIRRVKIKMGREPAVDRERVQVARTAVEPEVEIFVDANGAYARKQALAQAECFATFGVTWFEEPVSSDDLEGLRLLRDRAPAGMAIAAGEYGYALPSFRRMLDAGAVDVLQADVTRCAGITGLLQVSALYEAHAIPLSAHTAPALHTHPCCAMLPVQHVEYFSGHVRIEHLLFDGIPSLVDGVSQPDRSQPGLGLTFKRADAARYAI